MCGALRLSKYLKEYKGSMTKKTYKQKGVAMLNKINFTSLDGETQFKVFDRVMNCAKEIPNKLLKNQAMEAMAEIIFEETMIALAENSGPCEECDMEAETMEWQEFDKNFICTDCGHVQ